MIAVIVKFEVKDEVKKQLANIEVAKNHISGVVEACKKVPAVLRRSTSLWIPKHKLRVLC